MGDSYKAYCDDCREYSYLCKKYNVKKREDNVDYQHLRTLKEIDRQGK